MFFKESLNNALTYDDDEMLGPSEFKDKFGFTLRTYKIKDQTRLEICSFKLKMKSLWWSLIFFGIMCIANQFYKSPLLDYSLKE